MWGGGQAIRTCERRRGLRGVEGGGDPVPGRCWPDRQANHLNQLVYRIATNEWETPGGWDSIATRDGRAFLVSRFCAPAYKERWNANLLQVQ